MKIGIIGAMEQEVALLRSQLQDLTITTIANIEFYSGNLDGAEVVVTRSGICKVTAAIATTLLIERFAPDAVINTGSAGGFRKELAIGDVAQQRDLLAVIAYPLEVVDHAHQRQGLLACL